MNRSAKTKSLILFFIFVLTIPAWAESPTYDWSRGLGGQYDEDLGAVAINDEGETVCLGTFYDEIDLGGGVLTGVGGRDFFLAKYQADGTHLWSRPFGGLQNDSVGDVLAMSGGGYAISGAFRDTISFGGGGFYTATGLTDGFLAQFNADGVYQWSRAIGGAGSQSAQGIAEDSNGNIILVGSFFTEVDLGGGPMASAGTSDVFVGKFSSTGSFIWGRSFGSSMGEDEIYLDVDEDNNIVLLGDFTTTINLGGTDLVCVGERSFYLAKLSGTDGSHVWSQSIGGINGASGNAVAIDGLGNIVCVGEFVGPVDFGGGVLTTTGIFTDLFIAKYSADGSHVWSQGFGTMGVEPPTDVGVNVNNQIIFTGYHYLGEALDFGGGPLADAGGGDVFLVALGSDGSYLSSNSYGDASMQMGNSLAVGSDGEIILAGTFMGSPDFGGGPLPNNGGFDIFLVSLDSSWGVSSVFDSVPGRSALLQQNTPNPFNPMTRISLTLKAPQQVSLAVHDVRGRFIASLADGVFPIGEHSVIWDGKDWNSLGMASGIYFYRLETTDFIETKRMTLIK